MYRSNWDSDSDDYKLYIDSQIAAQQEIVDKANNYSIILSEITPSSVELLTTSYQIENLLSGTTLKDRALADVEFLPAHGDYQIGPGESTFQFISPLDGSKLYDTYTYDPRTALPRTTISKHAYVGTRFDDGAGGLFNSEESSPTAIILSL